MTAVELIGGRVHPDAVDNLARQVLGVAGSDDPIADLLAIAEALDVLPPSTATPPVYALPVLIGRIRDARRFCRRCGCTEDFACDVDGIACSWAAADVCSACDSGAFATEED